MASTNFGGKTAQRTKGAEVVVCPRAEEVRRAPQSVLSDKEQSALAAHLDECEHCYRISQGEQVGDVLANDVRRALGIREHLEVDINLPLSRLNSLLTDYEILREIGRGGMGIVYEARQLSLDRIVAVKVLPALLSAMRPDAADRFRREAALIARLDHSNIVGIHEFGEVEGCLYYTMQLVKGRSLRAMIDEISDSEVLDAALYFPLIAESDCSRLSDTKDSAGTRVGSQTQALRTYFRRVALWIAEVAEALHYAHEHGVVHRDIKPSNLLLSSDGRLMVSDFGLAHVANEPTLTRENSLLGTARYASPEQINGNGNATDRRVDVYGLGATLYELLTFRPLYTAQTDKEILNCVLHTDPAPPRRLVPRVPRELETICMTAIEKDPSRRFESAQAFGYDLRRYLMDIPIHARKPSVIERVARSIRRHRLKATVITAASVVVLTAASFSMVNRTLRDEASAARHAEQAQRQHTLLLTSKADFVRGEYRAGLSRVEQYLANEPSSVEARVLCAHFLSHLHRREEAIRLWEGVLEDQPDAWTAHRALATAYSRSNLERARFHQSRLERLQPKTADDYLVRSLVAPSPQEAIKLLTHALALAPESVDILVQRAVRYYQVEQYEQMLKDAERSALLRPRWSLPHGLCGNALHGLYRYEEAISCFDRTIKLEPEDGKWWHLRAQAKFQANHHEEAIADANVAIQLEPATAKAYVVRGSSRMASGDLSGGQADYSKAINLAPDEPLPYHDRGVGYIRAGLYEKAIESFSRCIAMLGEDDSRSFPYRGRAIAHFFADKHRQAVADFTRAIERSPTPRIADYHSRSVTALQDRQYELTISDCTYIIQRYDPVYSADAFLTRSLAHLRIGRHRDAIADLEHAYALDPNHPRFFVVRSHVSIALGNYKQAIADLSPMIEDTATCRGEFLLNRAFAYEMSGQADLAIAEYERLQRVGGQTAAFADLSRYAILRKLGEDDEALQILDVPATEAYVLDEWSRSLFALFEKSASSKEMIASAKTDAERCEAYYFVGILANIEGRRDDASAAFHKCIEFDEWNVLARVFAPGRLANLR
ncbi:MAG: protein kinase [Phycisphaerales bacterium]|nr:protein kinase [Phycisphaerales bacterium]